MPSSIHISEFELWRNQQCAAIAQLSDVNALRAALEHRNGYLRAAALQRCAGWQHPDLLPALIERLNDWVPQVRIQALSVLRTLLPKPEWAKNWVAVLPSIHQLCKKTRNDHLAFRHEVESFLCQPQHWPLLINGLQHGQAVCLRYCYRLLQTSQALPEIQLIEMALKRKDLVLTTQILHSCRHFAPELQNQLYRKFLRSPFSICRITALLALWRTESEDKDDLIRQAFFDPHKNVRELAWHWRDSIGMQADQIYHAIWQNPQASVGEILCAIWGALKVTDRSRIPQLQELSNSPTSTVRQAARLARVQLDPMSVDAVMQEALHDQAAGGNKLLIKLRQSNSASIPLHQLTELCATTHGAARILKFLHTLEKWDMMICLLIMRQHTHLQSNLDLRMNKWLDQDRIAYHPPTSTQKPVLQALLLNWQKNDFTERFAFVFKCNDLLPIA